MQTFHRLLLYMLVVATTNNFVWFALIFWAYLETQSVISTGFVGGIYLVATALSGFWFGAIVDHHRKKRAMLGSSAISFLLFGLGLAILYVLPETVFVSAASPALWVFAVLLLAGVVAGNIVNIAIPTLVTVLVPEGRRDKANGMVGTVMGVSFAITSVASGLVLGFFGMRWVMVLALVFSLLAFVLLAFIPVSEQQVIHTGADERRRVDIRGTIRVVRSIRGLFPLIFFSTFNNFLGGVFMALMDAYGLTLVSVEVWGILLGFLSLGFIFGGLIIAKKGLGGNPLRTLLLVNVVTWMICILFAVQPSIVLMFVGMLIWMILFPFIEAVEQTVIQKVVPPERQGRVFGFSQSLEQAASPLTSFLIGPITQLVFIPFMTTGAGVELIGDWFGTGPGRGMALVFILSGIIGLVVTLLALRSNAYRLLSSRYLNEA